MGTRIRTLARWAMSRRRSHSRPCPTATKTAYSTEGFALAALDYLHSVPPRDLDGPRPRRAYQCTCGDWHLTSRAESYAEIGERMAAADA